MQEKQVTGLDQKFEYLIKTFGRRTERKDTECFVLNMIWQKLCQKNCQIKPVAQQIVFGASGSHYLLDLYFPALQIAVECDEKHHEYQKKSDELRVEDVLSSLDPEEKELSPWQRLAVQFADASVKATFLRVQTYDVTYEQVCRQVDEIVDVIVDRRDKLEMLSPGSTKWDSWDADIKQFKNQTRNELISGKSPDFPKIVDAYNIFLGKPKEGMQRGFFRLGNLDFMLWFPQVPKIDEDGYVVPSNAKGWVNFIENDFSIVESNVLNPDESASPPENEKPRLTFVKGKNAFGDNVYRFAGVYKFSKINSRGRLYRRIAEGIHWTRQKGEEYPSELKLLHEISE